MLQRLQVHLQEILYISFIKNFPNFLNSNVFEDKPSLNGRFDVTTPNPSWIRYSTTVIFFFLNYRLYNKFCALCFLPSAPMQNVSTAKSQHSAHTILAVYIKNQLTGEYQHGIDENFKNSFNIKIQRSRLLSID